MNGTRFIVISAGLGMCGIASLAGAEGPPEGAAHLQLAARPTRLVPKRIAGIGPDMQLTTSWYEVKDQGTAEVPIGFTAQYDCFDANSTGFPEDESECGYANLRWYFGRTYNNPFVTNDMTLQAGSADQNDATQHAWIFMSGTCFIAVFHAEDFDETCAGPDSGGTFPGVLYSFGSIPAGGYYYYNPIDLTPYGLNMDNPRDGKGANIHLLGLYDGDEFILADSSTQLMLWGNNVGDTLAGSQGVIQWDDDEPLDGVHSAPNECHTYSLGVCPDPLGAMYATYGDVTPTCCVVAVTPIVAGREATFSVAGGPSGYRQYFCLYSFSRGTETYEDYHGICAELMINLPAKPEAHLVWQVSDSDGTFTKTVTIPNEAPVGRSVYFQVVGRGTCPEPCASNRLERLIH